MSSAHDFDFNHGDWDVTNRRLKVRGVGSDDWDVFPSYEKAQVLMGGMVYLGLGIYNNTRRTAEAVERLSRQP